MEKGWQCPVCGAGVAPDRHHCEHPSVADKLPDNFPDGALREAAVIMYPELNIEQESAKFRMHYSTERSTRWQHVWGKWLQGEQKWMTRQARVEGQAPKTLLGKSMRRLPRVRVWATTVYGSRYESSMELEAYEQAAAAGQPPELVDEGELPRLQALAKALKS
jgi:hypothetical protein